MSFPVPRFDPGRVTGGLEVLATILLTMGVLVAAFLTAAALIRQPVGITWTLVVVAIAIVPSFIGLLVLLLTRFRHLLLADVHYLEWLERQMRRFRGFRPRMQDGSGEGGDGEGETTSVGTKDLERARVARYEANRGVFLTYDWRPSTKPGQLADIVVRLQQHVSQGGQSGPLERGEIASVDYYLGPMFAGAEALVRRSAADGFRLDVSAYSPVLCLARVNLRSGGSPIVLEQYLSFGD